MATSDFVLRVHDVRDILDLMPVIQLVGPNEIRTVPPEDALTEALVQELDREERPVTELHATDSGAVMVKGPPAVQAKIAAAIHRIRTTMVRERAAGPLSPPQPSTR